LKLSIREPMAPGQTLLEKFRSLQELGFAGIELTTSSTMERVPEIQAAMRETGIQPTLTANRLGGCLIDARKEERELAVRSHVLALEVAAEVGAVGVISPPVITMKMQSGRPRIPDLSPIAAQSQLERDMVIALYGKIAERGAQLGTTVVVEPLNRYEQWWPCTVAEGVEICRRVNSPGCKTMADLFHMSIEETDIPAAIRNGGSEFIYNVHLADSHRHLPGSGHTDFRAAFAALKAIGYERYCGLECRVDGDPMTALRETVGFLRRTWDEA
jgi:sugar phosphate isomerase/epimerase